LFELEDYCTALFFLKKHTTRHVCRLDEPFVPEAIHSLPDGLVKWDETNPQIDQLLGGVFCPHQPALFVLLDSEVEAEFSKKNRMTLLLMMESTRGAQKWITCGLGIQDTDRQVWR